MQDYEYYDRTDYATLLNNIGIAMIKVGKYKSGYEEINSGL